MRRDPALVLSASLTLAVCIGANTTVFSIANSILVRPIPYPHQDVRGDFVLGAPELAQRRQQSEIIERFDRQGQAQRPRLRTVFRSRHWSCTPLSDAS